MTRAMVHVQAEPVRTTAHAEAQRDYRNALAGLSTTWVTAVAGATGAQAAQKVMAAWNFDLGQTIATSDRVVAHWAFVHGKRLAGDPSLFFYVQTKNWFIDWYTSTAQRINQASSDFSRQVSQAMSNLGNAAMQVGQQVIQFAGEVIDAIVETFAAGVKWTERMVNGVLQGVIEIGGAVIEIAREAAEAFGQKLLEMGKTLAELWELAQQFGDAAADVMDAFIKRPEVFLQNVIRGIQQGFEGFFASLPQELPGKLLEWLASKMQGLRLPPIPDTWDRTTTVPTFLLQLMQLDWDSLQEMLVEVVGADNIALVMDVFDYVQNLIGNGSDGLLNLLNQAEDLAYNVQNMVNDALAAGAQALVVPLVKAAGAFIVEKLALGPGVGVLLTLYRGLTWILDPETAQQLKDVVTVAINGVKQVAALTQPLPNPPLAAAIQNSLAHVIPMAINFVIKQIPALERLPGQVTTALLSVSTKVKDKLITWVNRVFARTRATLKRPAGLIGEVHQFDVGTETHYLWLAKRQGRLVIMLDGIGAAKELDLDKDLPANLPAAMREKIIRILATVRREGQNLANLLALKPPKFKEAKALQSKDGALGKALKELEKALVGAGCKRLLAACFAAGTHLLTPEGSKAIEEFRVGDLVLSRNEADPTGAVEAKVVEEVFVRLGVVYHVHVGGEVIRTTAEHPFWVEGQGWTPAWLLVQGDVLLGHDGRRMPVEEVFDTGEWDTVYNLRVADFHTYFVGSQEWAFSVWSHNAYIVLYRYDQGRGMPSQMQHWSIEITLNNGDVLHSHQDNYRNGMPNRDAAFAEYLLWHPKAWVDMWDTPGPLGRPYRYNKDIVITVGEDEALAAMAEVRRQEARPEYQWDLRMSSCFTYVASILRAAGISGIPSPAANNETMNAILQALLNLGDTE